VGPFPIFTLPEYPQLPLFVLVWKSRPKTLTVTPASFESKLPLPPLAEAFPQRRARCGPFSWPGFSAGTRSPPFSALPRNSLGFPFLHHSSYFLEPLFGILIWCGTTFCLFFRCIEVFLFYPFFFSPPVFAADSFLPVWIFICPSWILDCRPESLSLKVGVEEPPPSTGRIAFFA